MKQDYQNEIQKGDSAIVVDAVEKTFSVPLDRNQSIKTLLSQLLTFRFKNTEHEKRTVLQNLSFTIKKGDFVGVMGRNGAGKSTFLKIVSGIYKPTSGKVWTSGRIVPLLELGAGFAPELSGYENIFLNASILGVSEKDIKNLLPKIIEFSELGEHVYRPVKNYSSGMLVRLGFAVAAHIEADVFLFDEILAVGDAGFQKKCIAKIEELSKNKKTIILVTHAPEAVQAFCNRCIVFSETGIIFDGDANSGAEVYRKLF